MQKYDLIVIGAGIIGLSIALQVARIRTHLASTAPDLDLQPIVDSVDIFSRERGQSDDLTLVCFKRESSGPRSL